MYKRKIARLVSLIVQIKQHHYKELEKAINIQQVEELLDSPVIGDRNWENAPNEIRILFGRFLDVYINMYKEVLYKINNQIY